MDNKFLKHMEEFLKKKDSHEYNVFRVILLILVIGVCGYFISNYVRTGNINLGQVINSVKAVPTATVTTNSATITWDTDQPTSTKVVYGDTASYGSSTAKTDTNPKVTHHSATITGLLPNHTYHYQVKSRDDNSVLTISDDQTFTTLSDIPVVTDCVTSNDANVGTDSGTTRYCNVLYTWSQVVKTPDLQYATAPDGDSTLLKLDLYLPPNETGAPLPVALNAHGGGGDKSDTGWCKELATRGWACASINYRGAATEAGFNNANQRMAAMDYLAAIRYLRSNASKYNLDKNRFVATGVSAGGLTADIVGIISNDTKDTIITDDARIVQDDGTQPSWVCYSGSHPGGMTTSAMDNFLDANDPAYIRDWHGDLDTTLDYASTVSAFDRLDDTIPAELTTLVGKGHKLESADTIIPQLFADLYSKVILGSCPPSYSNIPHIN